MFAFTSLSTVVRSQFYNHNEKLMVLGVLTHVCFEPLRDRCIETLKERIIYERIGSKIRIHIPQLYFMGHGRRWAVSAITGFINPSVIGAVGRRKSSIANVRMSSGSGRITVNGRGLQNYLQYNLQYVNTAISPLSYLGVAKKYDLYIHVSGGGIKGQVDAIKLGIARCLCSIYPIIGRRKLKTLGYIRQDARCKERKKYGLLKARKAPQYSKR
jgi:small subunit ribosomal protein S9